MTGIVEELVSNNPIIISEFFFKEELDFLKKELEISQHIKNFSNFSLGFQDIINRKITHKIRLLFGKICSCKLEKATYFESLEDDIVILPEKIYNDSENNKRKYTILIIINSLTGFNGDIIIYNYNDKYKIDKGSILFKTFLRN